MELNERSLNYRELSYFKDAFGEVYPIFRRSSERQNQNQTKSQAQLKQEYDDELKRSEFSLSNHGKLPKPHEKSLNILTKTVRRSRLEERSSKKADESIEISRRIDRDLGKEKTKRQTNKQLNTLELKTIASLECRNSTREIEADKQFLSIRGDLNQPNRYSKDEYQRR